MTVSSERHQIIVGWILHDRSRDVLRIGDDLGQIGQPVGEFAFVCDREPAAEPVLGGTVDEPLDQTRGNDKRVAAARIA
ncbi:MAG: hypothetical protein M3O70_25945 [Actinomycetota bacterium]|nr:hypothetical protein [Actinomycetota bacterium]